MVETDFDVLNIEYMDYTSGEETYDYPDTMQITVDVPNDFKDKHYSFTEDLIRDEIEKITGPFYKVMDLTAFYAGTNEPLRGNYEDYEAETFEAREKKIGSIRIVKNPNFPSGTSLQAYIKTNRAELRKVFGNPNMGESGDGKSKGKEWNLVVGGKRVTIYDKREKDKKGTKYFNIGGDGKYGALLVAQALSIHRNERVYAKEIVPKWLEDKRQYQQVKSIDEHPDLTYERAKEYEDNRRRYRAESENDLTFKEWADQEMMTHGGRESFDDWLDDELKSHGDNISLQDWGHHELDSHYERYGAESFEDFKRKMVGDEVVAGDLGYMEALEEFYEDYLEDFERITDEFCPEPETFEEFQERVLKNDYEMSLEAEDWGGDPKGKLATALRNARIKAKQPKKPLKIEKLNAEFESLGYSYDDPPDDEDPMPEYYEIYLEDEEWKDMGLTEPESFEDYSKRINKEEDEMNELRKRWMKDYDYQQPKNAETSGQWEIGEQLEEAQMNAEGKKRKKLSGQLSDPFDELSLDSGDWKGIVIGFGVGLLGLFGYSKLRK